MIAGLCAVPACLNAQKPAASSSILDRRYQAAQDFQSKGDLEDAAQQYRIFLADSLGQLALGQARAGATEAASADFDEALHLVPDFPALQLESARVSLESGNAQHAQLLAAAVLQQHPADPKLKAKAHILNGRALLKLGKNKEAKQEIEQAVALDPNFENGYELAVADLDLGDGDGAAKIFAEMLASFGDTAQIHLLFGQAYAGSDFQNKAVDEFRAAIAKDDKLPGAHYSLAAAYVASSGESKAAETEAELRKEIALSPKNAAAYAALGHFLANEQKDEALADLVRATELDPASPDAFLYLGQMYVDRKQPAEAERALRRSIALTHDTSRNAFQVQKAHYLLGRLLIQTSRGDEGKQEIALSQALLRQNLSHDQDRLAEYLQTDKGADASPLPASPSSVAKDPEAVRLTANLEKQLAPAVADSYNNLGAIAAGGGDYKQAVQYFQRAAEWNPALPGLDFNWGRAAFAAGSPADAIGPLARYLRDHPLDDGARTVLGLSQCLAKDYAGARTTLASVADKPGAASQVRFAYARSLVETNDLAQGIPRLLTLEGSDPVVADVHRTLGEAYARQNASGAAAEYEAAIRLNPADAEAHAGLARLQIKQGNTAAAVANLEAAVRLDPANVAFREQLAQSKPRGANQ